MQCPSLGTWTLWYVEWYRNNTCFIWASGPWWYKWSPAACLLAVLCTLIGQSIFLYWLLSGVLWAIGRFLILSSTQCLESRLFLSLWFTLQRHALCCPRSGAVWPYFCWFETRKRRSHVCPFIRCCRNRQQACSPDTWELRQEGPRLLAILPLQGGLVSQPNQAKKTVEENNTQESLIPNLVPKEIVETSDLSKAMYPWANFYHILMNVYILLRSVISV